MDDELARTVREIAPKYFGPSKVPPGCMGEKMLYEAFAYNRPLMSDRESARQADSPDKSHYFYWEWERRCLERDMIQDVEHRIRLNGEKSELKRGLDQALRNCLRKR